MRPVVAGKLPLSALSDGSVGLLQVAILNDHLDLMDENQRRANIAMRDAKR